ncbi:MAG: ATP-dependent nuclease [Candidatus Heimdallarchaeota archaeon]
MFLEKLTINNFRGIDELSISFRRGINVIVGENNCHKTTILDALRFCFQFGDQYKGLFLSQDDFHINKSGARSSQIEFNLIFGGLTEEEKGIFIQLLLPEENGENDKLILNIAFALVEKNGVSRIRPKVTGGGGGVAVPQEVLELLYHIHLDALRDAARSLAPNRGNRLGQLFTKIINDETIQKDYANELNTAVNDCSQWNSLLDNARGKINENLNRTTIAGMAQNVDVNFVPLEFKRIVEGLKLIVPFIVSVPKDSFPDWTAEYEQYFENPASDDLEIKSEFIDELLNKSTLDNPVKQIISEILKQKLIQFDVTQNGLGYNNLIYISTVLGDIIQRAEIDKDSYVALLIEEPESHLHPQLQNVLFNYFRSNDKKIQIFITSHSPTITAKADIDTLIVLQNKSTTAASIPVRHTPVCSIPDNEKLKKQLERFLDVTKCQLFFSRGVIIVEGISEALLLPVFSDIISNNDNNYNLDQNGIEVVNIGGVAFKPFALLFNSQQSNTRLQSRCSIITDDDRKGGTEPCPRAQNIKQEENGNLKVYLAEQTFEYELYINNEDIMKSVYNNFDSDKETVEERALEFLKAREKQKAIYAQLLAEHLSENPANFIVPTYIQDAIKWAVKGL